MLWVRESGLAHYSSRTLLKGKFLHKSRIPKVKTTNINKFVYILIHECQYTFRDLKANALWQEDKLQRRELFREAFNITNMVECEMRKQNVKIIQQNVK